MQIKTRLGICTIDVPVQRGDPNTARQAPSRGNAYDLYHFSYFLIFPLICILVF